jgi:transcriptional regulator with XRE-family HTH domain
LRVTSRERPADRGARIARADLIRIGDDLRQARFGNGLALDRVGSACAMSGSQVSRIERGLAPTATVVQLARLGAVVGLDVRVHAYPGPEPIRDAAQVRLIGRFLARISPSLAFRAEVPLPAPGDLRAWDGWISRFIDGDGIPLEADTRIADYQAKLRRISSKMRDAGVRDVIWIVADTRANRAALDVAGPTVRERFPVPPRVAWRALAAGRHPGGSVLVLL